MEMEDKLSAAIAQMDDLLIQLKDVESMKGDSAGLTQQFTQSYALLVPLRGKGSLKLEDREYLLHTEAVYLCPPQSTFGIESEAPDELEMLILRFDLYQVENKELLCAANDTDGLPLRGEIHVHPAGQLAVLCDTIQSSWQNGAKIERFRSQIAFLELWYHIAKHCRPAVKDSLTALERAKAYIEEHYAENLTIEQLARIAEVSPKYFVDLFKKTFGKSAMDYLAEVRMNRAKQLMAQSHARLREIAHQVGYHDEFYFSRKFKKEVGVSPTVYMKSRRRKIAAYGSAIVGQLLPLKMIPYAAPIHPKWTAYYHRMYRNDIPVHLSAYLQMRDWKGNMEILEQAKPDMIISLDQITEPEKDRLGTIAPTHYIPAEEADWREQLRITAELLGEQAEAEDWLRKYDEKLVASRERLKREVQEETVLVVRFRKRDLYLHCNRSMSEVLYRDLGMNPAYSSSRPVYDCPTTLDELHALNPDRLLLLICQEEETIRHWNSLKLTSAWQELKAVRANRTCKIASDPWREYSAMAHLRMIDDACRLLAGDRP